MKGKIPIWARVFHQAHNTHCKFVWLYSLSELFYSKCYLQFISTIFGVVWIKLKILSQSSCSLLITDYIKKQFISDIFLPLKVPIPLRFETREEHYLGLCPFLNTFFPPLWMMTILLSFSKFYFLKKLCAVSNLK